MRTSQRRTVAALLIGVVIIGSPFALASATPQILAETVSEAMVPIRQAMNAAALGLHSVSPEDRHVNAQVLVNLFEGDQGDLYDAAYAGIVDLPGGLLAHLAPLDSASREAGDAVDLAIEDYGSLLRMANDGIRSIVNGGATEDAADDAFLTAFVFLSRAYADFQELLRDWEVEIWVRAGESIQSAIDRAWTGATLRIEPGVYRETLEISESVTLTGVGDGIVIQPVSEQDGILIRSPEDARVHVLNLAIRGADSGIRVLGVASCTLEDLEITGCQIGLQVHELAKVTLTGGRFAKNETAVHASGYGEARISDSHAEGSLDASGAVIASESSSLRLERTIVEKSAGNGILGIHHGTFSLVGCTVTSNASDGIVLTESATLQIVGTESSSNGGFGLRAIGVDCPDEIIAPIDPFTGRIDGRDNDLGDEAEGTANGSGPFCPGDLGFLVRD